MPATEEQLNLLTDRVSDCEKYAIGHDAKIDAFWNAQFKLNDELRSNYRHTDKRLTALEKRVVYLSALAAAAGAFLSGVIPIIFRSITHGG